MPAHVEHHDRQRERERNPKAARHFGKFAAAVAAKFRLQRHAAYRT